LRSHLVDLNLPYRYRPYASRFELASLARQYPNIIIFSLSHCVCARLTLC
jgi:hypothetical protein